MPNAAPSISSDYYRMAVLKKSVTSGTMDGYPVRLPGDRPLLRLHAPRASGSNSNKENVPLGGPFLMTLSRMRLRDTWIAVTLAALLPCGCGHLLGRTTNLSLSFAASGPGSTVNLNLFLTASGTSPTGLEWTLTYPLQAQISVNSVTVGALRSHDGRENAVMCSFTWLNHLSAERVECQCDGLRSDSHHSIGGIDQRGNNRDKHNQYGWR